MKRDEGRLILSATDLANHLSCGHLTTLQRDVAEGRRKRPDYFDPALKTLQERGYAHEASYLQHLRSSGLEVLELTTAGNIRDSQQQTLQAMRRGVDVIAQATLTSGQWLGYADVLRRVNIPSSLGAWSYQAHDTKLSRETKAGAVLQLSLYSDILEELQGARPEHMAVIAPGQPFLVHKLRVDDFRAYYRWVRRRLEAITGAPPEQTAAEPVPRCESCNWVRHCEAELRGVDHLSFVAGITRLHRRELEPRNVVTLAGLAALGVPLSWKPERGSTQSLVRVREQARIQHEGRSTGKPRHELLEVEPRRGLSLLPAPSAGDIFFDFEGDPFVDGGGLEYLFGYVAQDRAGALDHTALWAQDRVEEKRAFERFVDDVMRRWSDDPGMHVYHYAPYEPAAMRRLMGRHGTREAEVDKMLRGGLFVDLYTVVRQGIRASVESYSIKRLEIFFGYERDVALPDVGASKRALEAALELADGAPPEIDPKWREVVQLYNRDDCVSALKLRDWLESLRADLPRPEPREEEPNEKTREAELRSERLRSQLLALEQNKGAAMLMASLVDFHRREDRVIWWERFRLKDLPEEELEEEPKALFGMSLVGVVGGKKVPIHRYSFPPQVVDADVGASVFRPDAPEGEWDVGTVEAFAQAACTIDIKKTAKTAELHPTTVLLHSRVPLEPLPTSLFRLGTFIAEHGVDAAGPFRAARDLLLKHPPRLTPEGRGLKRLSQESPLEHAMRVGLELRDGVLPIQGPPGAGKTFTGARMIAALVAAGKRVGVTAMSHKVLRNLLEEVLIAARDAKLTIRCGHKVKSKSATPTSVKELTDNDQALESLANGEVQVLGGTPWLWAREDAMGSVDVLFIDEAGQLSLANALAVAGATSSLVLLGDPRQLEQPKKGAHPDGAEVSALEHLLGDSLTVPEDRGLFLEETWRLHPDIAAFTSLTFYERRLRPRAGLERQAIHAGPITQPGLWVLGVEHTGNPNVAPEEVDAIHALVEKLLEGGSTWTGADGIARPLTRDDILIVAPYNAQVDALNQRLSGMRIGTVDKFQGQEAAVVIISMTSSSIDDAPRGMDFLLSPNRFNVATSRARAACVLVASPALFEVDCRTPKQMRLANALCQYRELARMVAP